MRWMKQDGTGAQPADPLSQLSVSPPCVPAEAGAETHHGEDGAEQQG